MSGIAEIFLSQGHAVSGSDLGNSETTERLVRMGAVIQVGHSKDNVTDVDVVVISSAVKADNPEVLAAKALGIPVIPRAEMLAEIMRGKKGIAIAGTHGKTTTTSMTAQILMKAGLDPTVVVGGKVEAIGSNAKMGAGNVVVVEADESDGSFHLLPATHAVVTNIDLDHMEYYGTRENLNEAFLTFTKKIPFYGRIMLCGDDAGINEILSQVTKPHLTYGFGEHNDLIAKNPRMANGFQCFELWTREHRNEKHELQGEVELAVLGLHNILNALGAIGISLSMGASIHAIKEALREFKHVRRRFDERYFSPTTGIRIIDDYGHHPTEIRAVLATARQTAHPRIVTVFQPHRYTRTQLCWNEFLTCFAEADHVVILPIYAASEEPIAGVDSATLAKAIRDTLGQKIQVSEAASLEDAVEWVKKNRLSGDLILTMGAGSITKLPDLIVKQLGLN